MTGRKVALACLALFVVAAPREPWTGEARSLVAVARSLVERHTIDLAHAGELDDSVVRAGHRYAPVGLLPSLALVPAEAVVVGLRLADSARSRPIALVAESTAAAIPAALLCLVFFASVEPLGARRPIALALTCALATTTTVAVYARLPDGSVLAALLLLLAVESARQTMASGTVRSAALLGAAAGALPLTDGGLLAAAIAVVGWPLATGWRRAGRGARAAAALGPLAVGIGLYLLHRAHIGARPEPGGDLIEGLYGLVLSTGKSVFAYSPPLLCLPWALPHWWRHNRGDTLLLLLVAAAVILPAARLEAWHGDPAWGPRRLVALVPVLLGPVGPWLDATWPALRRRGRAALALVAAAGLAVQLLGVAFPPETYLRIAAQVKNGSGAAGWFGQAADQCHFIPQLSPLVGHAWLLSHLARHDRRLDHDPPWKLIVPGTPSLYAEWPHVRLNWWGLGWRVPATLARPDLVIR
jgi:hypothetical protein